MLQFSYYHELLNGIFYELERYSAFRISYKTLVRTDESGDSFVLESVNRMNDPELFGQALEKLITEVRARIMTETKLLTNRDLTLFLEEVLDRYLDLKKLVMEPGRMPLDAIKCRGIDREVYLFNPHSVSPGDGHDIQLSIPGSVLTQAAEFARTWFEQIDEAVARTRAFLAASWLRTDEGNKQGVNKQERNKPPSREKIILNCSVDRLGLHLKLLYEEGFFLNTTKTDVCKIVAQFICTEKRQDISYHSLKNAMDSPKEHAIRLFMDKWGDYLEKAENALYVN